MPRSFAGPYYMELEDEASRQTLRHWNFELGIPVSLFGVNDTALVLAGTAETNKLDSAVLMGILKAVFMLTTGGDPDAIFDYWVHFWQK